MTKREVRIGLATYRRADIPELHAFALQGATVDVHPDDLARFDSFNGPALPEPVEAVDEPAETELPSAPAGNASLEEWQGYARSLGASDDDLDGRTRNELRARYGSQS